MSLSLSLRKNLRDAEPLKAVQLKRIEVATGVSGWTFDADYAALAKDPATDESFRERLGEALFGSDYAYLNALADKIETGLKNPLVKEQFLKDTATKKITFKVWDGCEYSSTPEVHYNAGVLEIRQKSFPSNAGEVGNDLTKRLGQGGPYSFALKLDIANAKANADKQLARITAATGGAPWTFDVDWANVYTKTVDAGSKDRLAEILIGGDYSFLNNLAEKVEKEAKDDMVKEGLNAAAAKHKITFVFGQTEYSSTPEIHYEDGVLQIWQREDSFPCNSGDVGTDLQKRL